MGLFSKKKGGSLFGNLLASVANKVTGGILGAKRVAALQSGNLEAINPDAKEKGKMLKDFEEMTGQTTFAGQPATYDSETGTYKMSNSLNEVEIKSSAPPAGIWNSILDKVSDLGRSFSKDTQFGVDKNVLMLVGVLGAGFLIVLATKK